MGLMERLEMLTGSRVPVLRRCKLETVSEIQDPREEKTHEDRSSP